MPASHFSRKTTQAVILLKMVSHPIRLRILILLAEEGEQSVGEIAAKLNYNQPAISYHLTHCRLGGFVASSRRGLHRFYGLTETGEQFILAATDLRGT